MYFKQSETGEESGQRHLEGVLRDLKKKRPARAGLFE